MNVNGDTIRAIIQETSAQNDKHTDTIIELNTKLATKELESQIALRDQQIKYLNQRLAERDQELAESKSLIAELRQRLKEASVTNVGMAYSLIENKKGAVIVFDRLRQQFFSMLRFHQQDHIFPTLESIRYSCLPMDEEQEQQLMATLPPESSSPTVNLNFSAPVGQAIASVESINAK